MLKKFRLWAALGLTSLLVACGGGGDAGKSVYDGGGSSSSSSSTSSGTSSSSSSSSSSVAAVGVIEVLSGANTVSTSGEKVTITAVAKTADNVVVSGAQMSFKATTGNLNPAATTTDKSGVITASFDAGQDKSNRSATITFTSGTASGSITLPITGTKLTVSGPSTLRLTDSGELTFKALDSSGNAVPGMVLTLSSSLKNALSATSGTTDAQGQFSVSYKANNSGADVVSYSGAGTSGALSMVISGEDFSFTSPQPSVNIPVGQNQTVTVRYLKNGAGVSGKTVRFSTTNGTLTNGGQGVTDANGQASVVTSSNSAAAATILAQIDADSVQATLPINFVATTPARLTLQVSPTAISPNIVGATASQARVVAKVVDANGNPVPGLDINFSRALDPSGGNFQQPSAKTDLNGQASVQYIAGAQSTQNNGVRLHAEVASATSVSGDSSLTVNQKALFIALGTGNTIDNQDEQTYKKNWVVYVTDSNGVAVGGATLTLKILPVNYRKGSLVFIDPVWTAGEWDGSTVVTRTDGSTELPAGTSLSCQNEDSLLGDANSLSYNGTLDSGEDKNGDGILQPGNVISLLSGNLTTDATGRATATLLYAESYAPWVDVILQVQALVEGTESTTRARFVVNGKADDFTNKSVPPAGRVSPFGVRPSCSIAG